MATKHKAPKKRRSRTVSETVLRLFRAPHSRKRGGSPGHRPGCLVAMAMATMTKMVEFGVATLEATAKE